MQLRVARVCTDCEEVHESAQCPVCASENFAFLNQWVPSDERRALMRTEASSHRSSRSAQNILLGAGVLGGIGYVLNRWLITAREKVEKATDVKPIGKPR